MSEESIKVVCAIIEKNGFVLATQRSSLMSLPFLWEFPGGKMDIGETEETCIKREIKEELDIDIAILQRLTPSESFINQKRLVLIPFLCHHSSGTIALKEHMDMRWCTALELVNLSWCPADVAIVKEYIKMKEC